jgi:microsomal dipeptidase-like Zn-dependent dipeptidase
VVLLTALAAVAGSATAAAEPLANRCASVDGRTYYLKPTRPGHFMLWDGNRLLGADAPGPAAELTRRTLGRPLRAAPPGCPRYPEATVGARGRHFRGLRGFADSHLHVAADLRAGGSVISGAAYDRFGITLALGRDEEVHGPQGAADITGNLLRGDPAGTHDTHGWPSFAGWPAFDTYTHQQIYYRWLERAWRGGLRLVVAQTVEDEPLCAIEPDRTHSCDETATAALEVERLRGLQDYVDAQHGGRGRGWLRIVAGPRAAARVIRRGRLAVVIGLESSNPFGCTYKQRADGCDRAGIDAGIARLKALGIRGVFLAHWVDNALGGAAIEPPPKGTFIAAMQIAQDGYPFATGPCPFPEQGAECNTRGLTELGAYAVRRLMDAHMLIEVDHLSEAGREQVLALAEQRGYPLVSSHTGTGGTWTRDELRRLFALRGYGSATLGDAAELPKRILAFGRRGIGLGTDTGGFAALPGPGQPKLAYPFRYGGATFRRERTGTRTFDLNADGVAHYGLLVDLLADARAQPGGRRATRVLFSSAAAYLRTWRATGARG